MKPLILDSAWDEFRAWCIAKDQPGFRSDQVADWLFRKNVVDFSEMTNLPDGFRQILTSAFRILGTHASGKETDSDGTVKHVFRLFDGHCIEAVYLPRGADHTLCISSQVGCALGCRFCATGSMGIIRNLTSGEILSQIVHIRNIHGLTEPGNIVFMGMGEPLLNLEAVTGAIRMITDNRLFGWSARRITISTAGIVPEIRHLGKYNLGINLAVSLNASEDTTRSRLMPINKKYPLRNLIQALCEYPLAGSQQKITFEYVMLRNINDSLQDATRLVKLLDPRRDKVNLIPFNEASSGSRFKSSPHETVLLFQEKLIRAGFIVRIRQSQGASIRAGCGQLACRIESQGA